MNRRLAVERLRVRACGCVRTCVYVCTCVNVRACVCVPKTERKIKGNEEEEQERKLTRGFISALVPRRSKQLFVWLTEKSLWRRITFLSQGTDGKSRQILGIFSHWTKTTTKSYKTDGAAKRRFWHNEHSTKNIPPSFREAGYTRPRFRRLQKSADAHWSKEEKLAQASLSLFGDLTERTAPRSFLSHPHLTI